VKEERPELSSIATSAPSRDAEGLESQPLTRAYSHGGVLAAFPRELLKNGSRASS
jgi:hypothetical protein